MADLTVEQQARNYGWTPLEQFKGDPEKWLPAEAFVERGKEIMPILRKNNERLETEVANLRRDIKDAQEAAAEFRKYHTEVEERTYKRALADLKAQKVEALAESKFEAVVQLDDAITELEKGAPKPIAAAPKPAADPTQDPIYRGWAEEHSSWLGTDKERTAYATAAAQYVRAMEPTLVGRAFLDKVAEEVEAKFPRETPSKTSKVEGGTRGTNRSGGKTFSDLPTEAREACDRFGSKMVGPGKAFKTLAEWRTQYTADYNAMEG